MSDYRRLISYIYVYEGGVKGRNIGYARLETRGGQCRIYVNVKKVYIGANDIGVYLLTPKQEIRLGRIFVRGGAGEFRACVDTRNVEDSGYRMDDCYGLTIHDVESAWQCYTTIWEDAVAHAAEIVLADVTAENVRKKEEQKKTKAHEQELKTQQSEKEDLKETQITDDDEEPAQDVRPEPQATSEMRHVAGAESNQDQEEIKIEDLPISAQIEKELEQEEARQKDQVPWEEQPASNPALLETAPQQSKTEDPPIRPRFLGFWPQIKPSQRRNQEQLPEYQESSQLKDQALSQMEQREYGQQPGNLDSFDSISLGDEKKLAELDAQEQEILRENEQIWKQMQDRCARLRVFDYEHGCEILSIKPQDIGLLPREIWIYGNNSFLLHGYYNHRHLILARLGPSKAQKSPRYLLGVPGHYFNNEKTMAAMFGFPRFVLSINQPEEDGRFGYWYTDIRL